MSPSLEPIRRAQASALAMVPALFAPRPDAAKGVVRLSRQRRNERGESDRSGGRSRRCPRAIGFGSKEAKGRSADQVSLHVEVVVDGGVSREKPLR